MIFLRWLPPSLPIVWVVLARAPAPAAAQLLSYTLSDELKKTGCAGDTDADCLDNQREADLAWVVAPSYYYDENEGCARGERFRRRDFYQVRPFTPGPEGWSATDGSTKWLRVTYFFNYPHDCQSLFGFGGHMGDSEHVVYWLSSSDLRTWTLQAGDYAHHSRRDRFGGEYFFRVATQLGTDFPLVAADEDGHGSWPGRGADSNHCAGGEDNFCRSTCDCFSGTMRQAYDGGRYEWPMIVAENNVGGPFPELFLPSSVLEVGRDEGGAAPFARTVLDVGRGKIAEYWTPRAGFDRFCGWECPERGAAGDCLDRHAVMGRSRCAAPLSAKLDAHDFRGLASFPRVSLAR